MERTLWHQLYPTGERWIRSRRKRVSDLIICSIITPPAILFFLISSIAVLVFHGRPLLFKQIRVGRDGRHFVMHKLRTCIIEGHPTNLGQLLNVLGADETPQILYDVWRGKMGIIGARPLIPGDFDTMRRLLGECEYARWHRAYTACYPSWMSAFSQRSRLYAPQSPEYLWARHKWEIWYYAHARWDIDVRIFFRSLAMWCTDPRELSTSIYRCVTSPAAFKD